jgi:K+-transporting ATPase ATPase A chain
MAGITAQSFLSAATGMAVAIAMVRGFARHGGETIGNAWVDLTRATVYVLLPICVIGALFLASQGVPQTLAGPVNASTLGGATQVIARGPVASQEAIKHWPDGWPHARISRQEDPVGRGEDGCIGLLVVAATILV